MNATVQALRAIPELQAALSAPHAANTSSPLPKALATLYDSMGRTTDAVVPGSFLQVLRIVVPQFGEIDRNHRIGGMAGYAQQGACKIFFFRAFIPCSQRSVLICCIEPVLDRRGRMLGPDHKRVERGPVRLRLGNVKQEVCGVLYDGANATRVRSMFSNVNITRQLIFYSIIDSNATRPPKNPSPSHPRMCLKLNVISPTRLTTC